MEIETLAKIAKITGMLMPHIVGAIIMIVASYESWMKEKNMTIEELIQELEKLRDEHGPHIEVMKRTMVDGIMKLKPILRIAVDPGYAYPSDWKVTL